MPSRACRRLEARRAAEGTSRQLRAPVRIPDDVTQRRRNQPSPFSAKRRSKAAVAKAKQYIVDGDIMQVVLSQRMTKPFSASPMALYRALPTLNPSPYMFPLRLRRLPHRRRLAGDPFASNTRMAKSRHRPSDRRHAQAWRQRMTKTWRWSRTAGRPKERAEHVQLLDLGRNDVGRVAGRRRQGHREHDHRALLASMHIVSNVEGKLKRGLEGARCAQGDHAAGTLSGAPKVRAMEIIDELEPVKRGIYGGAIGYPGFNGDMDLAIAIRTAVPGRPDAMQAGAGIVADSDLTAEWQETQIRRGRSCVLRRWPSTALDSRVE